MDVAQRWKDHTKCGLGIEAPATNKLYKAMQEDGRGNLYTAFEELKKKLSSEGLFDESHKKPIPFMPKIIGVLTSNTGAVIRDIINVSTRRNPNCYIKLLPVPVQGMPGRNGPGTIRQTESRPGKGQRQDARNEGLPTVRTGTSGIDVR